MRLIISTSILALIALSPALMGQAKVTPGNLDSMRPSYVLGPGDQVMINAAEMDDISGRPALIDADGNLNLPTLGVVKAGGLSVQELEARLATLLKKYVQNPQVTVNVTQFRSEPVFFEGAFNHPGIVMLQGKRTLVEMIANVGGTANNASRYVTVTRHKEMGALPLPNAIDSPDGATTSVTISMASLRNDISPAENIVLEPYDVITAERAEFIYVNGAINRVGGLDLAERESMSVTQVLTMAGGMKSNADGAHAVLLRPVMNSMRRSEIPLDLDKIMRGKETDYPLLANDLLFIPTKTAFKALSGRTLMMVLPMALTLSLLFVRVF